MDTANHGSKMGHKRQARSGFPATWDKPCLISGKMAVSWHPISFKIVCSFGKQRMHFRFASGA